MTPNSDDGIYRTTLYNFAYRIILLRQNYMTPCHQPFYHLLSPPITQSSTISALFPIFLAQKFGNLKKSRTFAPRLRDNATAQSGKGSLGEWLKPPVC